MILSQYVSALITGRKMEHERIKNTRLVINTLRNQQESHQKEDLMSSNGSRTFKPPLHHYKSELMALFSKPEIIEQMSSLGEESMFEVMKQHELDSIRMRQQNRTFSVVQEMPDRSDAQKDGVAFKADSIVIDATGIAHTQPIDAMPAEMPPKWSLSDTPSYDPHSGESGESSTDPDEKDDDQTPKELSRMDRLDSAFFYIDSCLSDSLI
jgi:hypothetical protein